MSRTFAELAWSDTPMGVISLWRRREPTVGVDVYEVKLGDEYLMSSLFTVAETELARAGLAALGSGWPAGDGPAGDGSAGEGPTGDGLDVVVGGLGLGYTARAVLEDPRVRSLVVVETLAEVIAWHRRELLPEAAALVADPRTHLRHGDFFALADRDEGFGPDEGPGPEAASRVHAILLDIDHTPRHVLDPAHAAFYTAPALRRMARHLHPGGVFGMWSDDPPDPDFRALLGEVFGPVEARVVEFANPLTGGRSANTVYLARWGPVAGSAGTTENWPG